MKQPCASRLLSSSSQQLQPKLAFVACTGRLRIPPSKVLSRASLEAAGKPKPSQFLAAVLTLAQRNSTNKFCAAPALAASKL